MKVRFTKEAETNLETIADYIASDNPKRALSFVAEIRLKALDIGTFPEAFPVVGRYEANKVRRRVYSDYLIFYRIFDNHVEVLQVIHGATSPAAWRLKG